MNLDDRGVGQDRSRAPVDPHCAFRTLALGGNPSCEHTMVAHILILWDRARPILSGRRGAARPRSGMVSTRYWQKFYVATNQYNKVMTNLCSSGV